MILSNQEPTEVQISLKLKLCRKNQKCMLVIALNPKILYMRFQSVQLNRTLMKKIIDMKDVRKNAQNIRNLTFRIEWVKSPL